MLYPFMCFSDETETDTLLNLDVSIMSYGNTIESIDCLFHFLFRSLYLPS